MSSSEFASESARRTSQFLEIIADSEKMGPYADELSATVQNCLEISLEELSDDLLENVAGGTACTERRLPEKFI